jgi:hypothetical protein
MEDDDNLPEKLRVIGGWENGESWRQAEENYKAARSTLWVFFTLFVLALSSILGIAFYFSK